MSLTQTQLVTLFKNLGKLIYTAQLTSGNRDLLRQHMLNLNRQFATNADPGDGGLSYNVLASYDVPFQESINTIIVQEDSGSGSVSMGVANYLALIAAYVGAQATDLPLTILNKLAVNMVGATGYVLPSGATDQYHSFAAYFGQNFAATLPQSPSGILLDSWIATTVV